MSRISTCLSTGLLASLLWMTTPVATEVAAQSKVGAITPAAAPATVSLQDLPSGFSSLPGEVLDSMRAEASAGGVAFENMFGYLHDERYEMLMGFTIAVPEEIEQFGYDSTIQERPDLFLQEFVRGMRHSLGSASFVEEGEIQYLSGIGDSAASFATNIRVEGIPMLVEGLTFRRGDRAAFVVSIYIDEGTPPLLTVRDLASVFDRRLASAR